MSSFARILLAGAVAVTTIAISAAPSEAAAKKRMKGLAAGTAPGQLCTTPSVTPNVGAVLLWGHDNKWYQAGWSCTQPWCPVACSR